MLVKCLILLLVLTFAADAEEKVQESNGNSQIKKEEGVKVVIENDSNNVVSNPVKDEKPIEEPQQDNPKSNDKEDSEDEDSDSDSEDYKKGSVCVYCKYCKLCDLCYQCPCKTPDQHELCKNCKYCKYCTLCDTVCDTVCTPGSFLDVFSSAVYEVMPTFDKKTREDINGDIDRAKDFIKEYL